MDGESVERRLTALLSADVVGYSRLMARDEVATVRMLTAYRDQMEVLVRQHRGRIVDSPGDNILAEFASATNALECAGEIQRVLQARNAPLAPERRMEFRIGVHLGEVMVDGDRIYGDGVNIAARLEGLAEPGGICISETVHDQVESKVRLRYEDLGAQQLKNIARPLHVYRARWETVEPAGAAAEPAAARRSRTPLLAAAVVLLLAAAGAAAWLLYTPAGPSVPSAGPSLAVLPFNNLSGDPEQEYFADGLTEDLITDLSRVTGLAVIARNSVFTYKGRAVLVEDVGRELGVSHVLEGSVRKAGGRVRISAQLIDARDGTHVWADRYDRSLDDIFDVQDEVTESIVSALRIHLTDAERRTIERDPTENMAAYDLYLQGMAFAQQLGPEASGRAASLFEQVIELDPDFGPAYAALAATTMGGWYSQWDPDPDAPVRAAELVDRALELDDAYVPALVVAADVYPHVERGKEGMAAARRAVELAPGSANAQRILANFLTSQGHVEEAARAFETALRLNPLDPLVCFHAAIFYFIGRQYERARAIALQGVGATPDFVGLHGVLMAIYSEMGQYEEARAEGAEVLRVSPDFSLDELESRNLRFAPPEITRRILDAARKAGLQEHRPGEGR